MTVKDVCDASHTHVVTFYHDTEQDLAGIPNVETENCRQAVRAFLKLERKYHVPASYNVVGKLFETQPEVITWINDDAQDVAFHSYSHDMPVKNVDYLVEIERCRKLSATPKGYHSPRGEFNQDTIKTLWDNGFLWSAETVRQTEPFFVYAGLVQLPIAMDDWLLYAGPAQRSKPIDANEWLGRFSKLFDSRRYIAVGIHDSVASLVPEVIDVYERAIHAAIERKALLASFSQTTDLFRRRVLSDFYSSTAKSWNRSSKTLYRTKRFKEIIQSEAMRFKNPIVADLGSGGALLTSSLKEIAKEIYCIDNAPGMLGEVDPTGVMRSRLGEVTETGLTENSADLVVCARVIEYLFDPDQLAYEIARIGKLGGTFVVTFPATGSASKKDGNFRYSTPDQRIRRYFTSDSIKLWAESIGPGRLLGIQYYSREPNTKTEEEYRRVEREPPSGAHPTDWVYIGSIQNKSHQRRQAVLPISTFAFRNKEELGVKERMIRVGLRFPRPIRRVGRVLLRGNE